MRASIPRRQVVAVVAVAALLSLGATDGAAAPPPEVPDPFPLGTCVRVPAVNPNWVCVYLDPGGPGVVR